MDKPFTIKIEESEKKVVDIINQSQIPAYCWKIILHNLLQHVEITDQNEISEYKKKLEEEKEVKENDKN